jgi:cystathionine beta-lyase
MVDIELTLDELRARPGYKWHRFGDDVVPMWIADMDFRVAAPVQAAIERQVAAEAYGYGSQPTGHVLENAYVERMRACYGLDLDPGLVEPTTELIQMMYAVLLAFCEPGEGAVLQTPIYPPFLNALKDTGRRLVDHPLRHDGRRLALDVDGLRQVVDSSTRVLMICNPHNPTGRVFDRDELLTLGQLAVERDLIILVDEIHQDLIYAGHRHIPMASLGPEIAARTITITSATKGFNIAGLRTAVASYGSAALRQRLHQSIPQRVMGQVSTIGIEATVAAWQHGQPWLDAVLAQLTANRARLGAFVRDEAPAVHYVEPEGTYLAWLDFRDVAGLNEPGVACRYFLEQAQVALGEGAAFGTHGATCVRLNFATAPAILDLALDRMGAAMREMGAGA